MDYDSKIDATMLFRTFKTSLVYRKPDKEHNDKIHNVNCVFKLRCPSL